MQRSSRSPVNLSRTFPRRIGPAASTSGSVLWHRSNSRNEEPSVQLRWGLCPRPLCANTLRHPAYSAAAIPFAWMLADSMPALGEEQALDVEAEREPDLGFKTQWIQDHRNHKALLEGFRSHIVADESLCFFYSKQVPFVEDPGLRRILVGVGRVKHIAPCVEYRYTTKKLDDKLRSMLWELMVQHSIRPNFKDGFLLPYHAAIGLAESDPEFDPGDIAAFSPDDRSLEFSHVAQLVTHDGAIACLLACADSLRKAKERLPGPWDQCLEWLDHHLDELWKVRGPCPGLGAALCAFGVDLGTFVARAVAEKTGDNANPWPLVDKVFDRRKSICQPISLAASARLCVRSGVVSSRISERFLNYSVASSLPRSRRKRFTIPFGARRLGSTLTSLGFSPIPTCYMNSRV